MTYSYKCLLCSKETEITKPMSDSDRVEYCEICESELIRVYNAPSIITNDGVKQ